MLGTRPYVAVAISILSQFLENPKPTHIKLAQHLLQYVKVNPNIGIRYKANSEPKLIGYADASYGSETDFSSRSGYGFMLAGGLISWYSGKQKNTVPAQSSEKAEYYAAVLAANEAIWFRQLLEDLGSPQDTIIIHEDNQACISLTKNPEDHKRSKHIQIKYHVIRGYVKEKLIKFEYCRTNDQLADIFTKGVSGPKLRSGLKDLGVRELEATELKGQRES